MEIILIRHGKPISGNNIKTNAVGYAKWVKRYNHSYVSEHSRPENIIEDFNAYYLVASDLNRAIHSAKIYLQKTPEEINKLYREMDIPRYKLPFNLNTWTWVYLSRLLWMLGVSGPFESFVFAKKRADLAANELIKLAEQHDKVILFGHGFINRYIRKSLIKKGWRLNQKSNAFWGITSLGS